MSADGFSPPRLRANCFLRASPDPAAVPLGLGKGGATLCPVGAARDGWLPVAYRGGVAWVNERFLERILETQGR